jgi:hypothetical protein
MLALSSFKQSVTYQDMVRLDSIQGGIANILSLARVQKQFRVTYDSNNNNEFTVQNQHMCKFTMSTRGLYYCDMKQQQGNVLLNDATAKGGNAIPTVAKNKAGYTTRDIKRANKARKFQETTGMSLHTLLETIDRKLLTNCPITRADVKAAEDIYGTSIAHLKGKTVRRQGKHVTSLVTILPSTIADKYKLVTLCGDIFYVNGISFFATISRHIQFQTAEHINDAKTNTLVPALKSI